VDAGAAPYCSDIRQLSVATLCTNRDLPLFMPLGVGDTDFNMDRTEPIRSIRCVVDPTSPRQSHAEGDATWRLISHLSLNYLSLTDTNEQDGAAGLRAILDLYGDGRDPGIRKQIDGVKSIKCSPTILRFTETIPVAFVRGLEVAVTFDETAFKGTGCFLLGAVLEQFFAKYVSINSFTQTKVVTLSGGEIIRWPAKIGQRSII